MESPARARGPELHSRSGFPFQKTGRVKCQSVFFLAGVHREFVARRKEFLDSFHRTWTGFHSRNEDGVAIQVRILDDQIIPRGNKAAAEFQLLQDWGLGVVGIQKDQDLLIGSNQPPDLPDDLFRGGGAG